MQAARPRAHESVAHHRERVCQRQYLGDMSRCQCSALIGNSVPARNHGKVSTAGVALMYSSWPLHAAG